MFYYGLSNTTFETPNHAFTPKSLWGLKSEIGPPYLNRFTLAKVMLLWNHNVIIMFHYLLI